MDELQSTEKLLMSVSSLIIGHQESARNISKRGEAFNVFKLCGIDHYEVWHSKILAEFLSPTGSHGQGDSFLRAFFDMLKIDWDSRNARVYTEVSSKIGDEAIGRLDILIEGSDYGIVIENKLFAAEQPDQLARYSKWLLEKYGERGRLIFLTPNGRESLTVVDEKYDRLAYLESKIDSGDGVYIDKWLRKCQGIAVEAPFVRETIAQYSNHIKNVIKGGIGMSNEVSAKIQENPEAAQLVFLGYKAAIVSQVNSLIRDAFHDCKMEGEISFDNRERGLKVVVRDRYKVFIGFEETGLKSCFIGVHVDDVSESVKEKMQDWDAWKKCVADVKKDFDFDCTKAWPIWTYMPIKIGETSYCDWDGKFLQMARSPEVRDLIFATVKKYYDGICDFLMKMSKQS